MFKDRKLTLTVTTVIILLIIISAYFYFIYEANTIEKEKNLDLQAIAELKVNILNQWYAERKASALTTIQSSYFIAGVQNWLLKKTNKQYRAALVTRLNIPQKNYGYKDVFIASTQGKFLISSQNIAMDIDEELSKKIIEASLSQKLSFTDLYYCYLHKTIHYDILAPIVNDRGKTIAVLIFRIDPKDYLYPIIKSWPVQSKTSETLIVRKEADSVIFLNELRHQKNKGLDFKISLNRIDVPAVRAVLGHKGIIKGKDYRGVDVLAFISKIPGTQWHMITKVDTNEVFAELYYRAGATAIITFILIFLTGGFSFFIYNVRQKTFYKELFMKEKELREYHEEFRTILYSIGDGVITTDLHGNVKQINQTASKLTGWSEKDAVGKQIGLVFNIINENTRKSVENPVQKVFREGTLIGRANHTLLISKNGDEIPIADSGSPIRNEKGETKGAVLVFRDKTDEHKAERILRMNEARLRRAEFVSKIGNWELHLNSKTMIASEGAAKIYGLDNNVWNLDEIQKIPLPEYRDMLDEALINLVNHCKPYDVEFKIQNTNNGRITDVHSVAEYNKESNILFGVIQDITDRKHIEEELKEYQFWLEESQQIACIGSYNFDIKSQMWSASRGLNLIFGITDEFEKNTQTWLSLIHPDFKEEMSDYLLKEVIGNRKEFNKVYKIIRTNDNKTRWVWGRGELKFDSDGNPVRMIGTIQDVTERKIAEEALIKSEEDLSITLNSIGDGVISTDQLGIVVRMNPIAEKMCGWTLNEAVGKPLKEVFNIINAKSKKKVDNPVKKVIEDGEIVGLANHTVLISRNGKEYHIADSASPIKDGNGKIKGVVLVFSDVTEKYAAQEELQKKELLLRETGKIAKVGGWEFDVKTLEGTWTDEVVRIYDLEQSQKTNAATGIEFYTPDSRIKIESATKYAIEKKTPYDLELEMITAKGNRKWVRTIGNPIIEDNQVVKLYGSFQDITEKKLVEESLEKYRSHLEELVKERTQEIDAINRELVLEIERKEQVEKLLKESLDKEKELNVLKSRFISTTSHEFRTPLTSVLSSAELIQRYGRKWSDEKLAHHTDKIKSSIEYLTNLLDDVLTISRSESGKIFFAPSIIDLKNVCMELIDELWIQASPEHKINFVFLPVRNEYFLDPKLIRFIVINLLSNAIKYSPDGGAINFSVSEKDGHILLIISDNGIGIPPEEMPRLFEPFNRAQNSIGIPGTGLGLSIVKRAVDLHSGEIKIESELKKGTKFIIKLPFNNK